MADMIPVWSDYFLTDQGLTQRTRAMVEGLQIKFIRGEIGQGVPIDPADIWTMNALVLPAKQVVIKKSYAEDTTHHMIVFIDNEDYKEELYMREIGVFSQLVDKNGTLIGGEILYSYAYTLHGYEPIPTGEAFRRTWEISANTGISRASSVQILFDESMIYVSTSDLDTRLLPLESTYDLVTITHSLGCYPSVSMLGTLQWGAGMGGAGEGAASGTAIRQIPHQVTWHDMDSLSVRTIRPVAELGAAQLNKIDTYEYTVTFEGDALNSVYIALAAHNKFGKDV